LFCFNIKQKIDNQTQNLFHIIASGGNSVYYYFFGFVKMKQTQAVLVLSLLYLVGFTICSQVLVGMTGNIDGYPQLTTGSGDRWRDVRQTFPTAFPGAPSVAVSISLIDATAAALWLEVLSTDQFGFWYRVRTWGTHQVWHYQVSWTATYA